MDKKIAGLLGAAAALTTMRTEIPIEDELASLLRDTQFVVVGIKDFNAVLRPFGEGRAMPSIFLRAIGAWLRLAGPARHFEFGSTRLQSWIY
jgi:hypothetical protein